jgi:hypothetical protein
MHLAPPPPPLPSSSQLFIPTASPFLPLPPLHITSPISHPHLPFLTEHTLPLRLLQFQQSKNKPAVIESWQFESEQFRKIRITYIDAGINAQVNPRP